MISDVAGLQAHLTYYVVTLILSSRTDEWVDGQSPWLSFRLSFQSRDIFLCSLFRFLQFVLQTSYLAHVLQIFICNIDDQPLCQLIYKLKMMNTMWTHLLWYANIRWNIEAAVWLKYEMFSINDQYLPLGSHFMRNKPYSCLDELNHPLKSILILRALSARICQTWGMID